MGLLESAKARRRDRSRHGVEGEGLLDREGSLGSP